MDPITMSLLATGGAGLMDYIFGGNQDTMTPEQKRALEYVWQELQKSDMQLGFSPQEKMGMQSKLKTGLQDYSTSQIGSATSSMARRGMLSPGQTAGMTADIMSGAGKAYGQGLTDIELGSAQAGRQRKGQYLSMLPGLSQGYMAPQPDFGASLSDYISNLTYYLASKKKQPYSGQSYSNMRAPSMWGY